VAGAETLLQEVGRRKSKGFQLAFWLRDHNLDVVLAQSGLSKAIGAANIRSPWRWFICVFY